MILETHFNQLMEILLSKEFNNTISEQELIHSIDLTLLDEQASLTSLQQLEKAANQSHTAALCVYPQHLESVSTSNRVIESVSTSNRVIESVSTSNRVNLATVINFPHGEDSLANSLAQIEQAIKLGAVEIDYVLPYKNYLQGHKQKALEQCQTVAELCRQHQLLLKIIIESGTFPDLQSIYDLSKELIASGCDFIKTSTGKIAKGASLLATFAILSAIKDSKSSTGIKVSGGIKTPKQALHYALLAELITGRAIDNQWFRIGASSLLDELLKTR